MIKREPCAYLSGRAKDLQMRHSRYVCMHDPKTLKDSY